MEEIFDALRERVEGTVPELETEFKPLVMDQINDLAGVQEPIEVKVFGPEPATLRELAGQGRRNRREGRRRRRRQHPRPPRQSRHRGPSRQRSDRARRPDRARRGEPAQRRPLRPGGQHAPRAGPDDQDPRPLSRPGTLRPGEPGPVADQSRMATAAPTSPAPGTPAAAGIGFVPLDQLASIRIVRSPNELWRENQQPVITVTARLDKRDCGLREPRAPVRALGARSSRPATAGSWPAITGRSRSRSPAC